MSTGLLWKNSNAFSDSGTRFCLVLRFSALASASLARNEYSVMRAVYSHVCGDNPLPDNWKAQELGTPPTLVGTTVRPGRAVRPQAGTPPRLWGKRHAYHAAGLFLRYTLTPVGKTYLTSKPVNMTRYTPTPVGKTANLDGKRRELTVYPHACGENPSAIFVILEGTPLVLGLALAQPRASCRPCRRPAGVLRVLPRLDNAEPPRVEHIYL